MSSPFQNIDNALSRYYESLGITGYLNDAGIGKFMAMVQENELDEDEIEDELNENVEDCMYLDFDNNFPFPPDQQFNDADQQQLFKLNIIKKCHNNPNITFKNYNIPQNNQQNKPQNKKKKEQQPSDIDDNKDATTDIIGSQQGSKILAVCNAIGRYYKSINMAYNRIFSAYCYENGITALAEELDQEEPSLCILTDFDEGFPFKDELKSADEADQQQFIFDLIKKCYNNPNIAFCGKLPSCLLSTATIKYLYSITEKEYIETREQYKIQCPTLWNAGMDTDRGFSYIICIGNKHKFDYYQYLVDDYLRERIKNIEINYKEEEWAKNHRHFQSLNGVKFEIPWKNETKDTDKFLGKKSNGNDIGDVRDASELLKSAVKVFGKRCVPKMQFDHLISINDSLEIIAKYIDAAAGFIRYILDSSKNRDNALCPFQVDFCIGFDEAKEMDIKIDDDEDDDDEDDDDEDDEDDKKEKEIVDVIGSIGDKLKANNLKYMFGSQTPANENDFEYMSVRGFSKVFDEFIEKYEKPPQIYMHNKRLIVFIDRRSKSKEKGDNINKQKRTKINEDDIWMYEAPENCRNIPNDAVPEWHISASKTCLLPNKNYGDESDAECDNNNKSKEKGDNINIVCSAPCYGQILTVSFIVKQSDDIKCYLYWNGEITRFEAEDIRNILPKMINMKWNNGKNLKKVGVNKENSMPIYQESENEKFLKYKEKKQQNGDKNGIKKKNDIDAIIERINNNITDTKFNSFIKNRL